MSTLRRRQPQTPPPNPAANSSTPEESKIHTIKSPGRIIVSLGSLAIFASTLLLLDCLLTTFIIYRVPYTEIDYGTYLAQAHAAVVRGERDYTRVSGPSGPCVYPAGHLWLFGMIGVATGWKGMLQDGIDERDDNDGTTELRAAQCGFGVAYLATLGTALWIYARCAGCAASRAPDGGGAAPTTFHARCAALLGGAARSVRVPMAVLVLSRRLHSLYVLRLFNDAAASLLFYVAVAAFVRAAGSPPGPAARWSRWHTGCVIYSAAVSIKMNVLLSAPGLLLLFLQSQRDIYGVVSCLATCAAVQVAVGSPFLAAHPVAYVTRAFQFSRVFEYKWTVNWKFLPENTFVSKELSIILLLLLVTSLALFATKWTRAARKETGRVLFLCGDGTVGPRRGLTACYVVQTLFTSNFLGVAFARTLHYQFYMWYFHTIPIMLWMCRRSGTRGVAGGVWNGLTGAGALARLALVAAIEVSFNIFPATWWSSALLQASHLIVLGLLCISAVPPILER